jgi:transaldolase
MENMTQLKVKLFADGADKKGILEMYKHPWIKGFTTNPTLMRKAGISDYRAFAFDILSLIKDRSISFEVFADEFTEMEEQAKEISSWGQNVMVKIPIMNTLGHSSLPLIEKLSDEGIPLNVTAIMTVKQVEDIATVLCPKTPAIVSVFAGRIADTGLDPMPIMQKSIALLEKLPLAELLWASSRELLNLIQANAIGCHIITATNDILNKLHLIGKSLEEFSLETVKIFYKDAVAAGYQIAALEEAV